MDSNAWLLTDVSGDFFAVSEVEMIEYKPQVTLLPVPIAPYYCKHVMPWREQLIPVVNFSFIFNGSEKNTLSQVGVFAYQTEKNTVLKYLAIAIMESPQHISVNDNQFCELPAQYTDYKATLAYSCFVYQEHSVPIINLNYLCSTEFRNTMQRSNGIKQ